MASYAASPAPVASPPAYLQPVVYTVPSVGYLGPARIGAAVTAAFMLLPCVTLGFIGAWLVHAGRRLLDSWLVASIPVPIPITPINLPMNFVDLLRLRPVYDVLIYWDDRLWLTFAILWLVPWVAWIVAGTIFAVVLAAIYNLVGKLGGGIRVTMVPTSATPLGPPAATSAWTPGQPGSSAPWPGQGWPSERHR
jgi:hypothetical protein